MKNRTWIIIFAAVLLICAAVILLRSNSRGGSKIAEIVRDGEIIETIDLNKVTEPYDILIKTDDGYNIVRAEPGAVSVSEADCPDKICVNQGVITDGAYPIVCLPHKVTVRIVSGESENEIDAVTGR